MIDFLRDYFKWLLLLASIVGMGFLLFGVVMGQIEPWEEGKKYVADRMGHDEIVQLDFRRTTNYEEDVLLDYATGVFLVIPSLEMVRVTKLPNGEWDFLSSSRVKQSYVGTIFFYILLFVSSLIFFRIQKA